MNTMVVLVVLLVALVVLAAVIVIVLLRRNAPKKPAQKAYTPPQDPFADVGEIHGDPLGLRPGDMLEYGAEQAWVRGTLRLSEGGAVWAEHFIEVEGGRRWLSVEQDPDLQMGLWTGRPDLELSPSGRTIELEGTTYTLTERGSASYRSEGTTGLRAQGGMDYADYEAGSALLAFERFDHGRWEAATGLVVLRGDLTIYPSSDNRGA